MKPWRKQAALHGIRSSSALPLSDGVRIVGALTIYSDQVGFFAAEEASLLRALAEDISFALETISDREEKMMAEGELRSLMEELRELTAYLQEMRETERTAIAREIHDELGQIITALRIYLVWIKNTYKDHKSLFNKSNAMLAL
jgi:signal transduction histidine kinase